MSLALESVVREKTEDSLEAVMFSPMGDYFLYYSIGGLERCFNRSLPHCFNNSFLATYHTKTSIPILMYCFIKIGSMNIVDRQDNNPCSSKVKSYGAGSRSTKQGPIVAKHSRKESAPLGSVFVAVRLSVILLSSIS